MDGVGRRGECMGWGGEVNVWMGRRGEWMGWGGEVNGWDGEER